jgi:hypothetical protein
MGFRSRLTQNGAKSALRLHAETEICPGFGRKIKLNLSLADV